MPDKNTRFAFTIAEALMTFVLMGAIFVVTVGNINFKPVNNYTKLYWQAFNTLYQASKSVHQEWEAESVEKCPSCNNNSNQATCYRSECWRNSTVQNCPNCAGQERTYLGGTSNIDRDFPGFLYNHNINNALAGRGQDKEFCKKLTEKINTLPSGKCESFISVANPYTITNDNKTGGKNFLEAFSYALENSDGTYEQVYADGGISPSFVALNGQKFYISSVVTANTPEMLGSAWAHFSHKNRESYRFVVVDLNGDSKPNTQFIKNSKNPDIVLFAINSMGDVIPLGLPEFSRSYINAVVYYPNDLNDDGSRMYPNIKSEPVTLWYAKSLAFGNETCGGGANPLPYGSAVSSIEPFSQSAKFYAVATTCKNNVKGCSNKNAGENEIYADELFVHLVMQFLFKEENSTDLYPYLTKSECVYNSAENGCTPIYSESEAPPCAIDIKP